MAEQSTHAWAGRFAQKPSDILNAINRSIDVDVRLWPHDIAGSRAHAAMLASIGVLTVDEARAIDDGLEQIAAEFARGEFGIEEVDEDIHMLVERRLTQLIGDAGRKLHTGRSRNDQVATDARLFVRAASQATGQRLVALVAELAALGERHAADPLPAYTHMQRGMPTTLGHHLLAWAEMFVRDHERVAQAAARANVSPLGSGACVGSSFALDRDATAEALGFAGVTHNSLDAVSDRDFVADFVYAASMIMVHLSRVGEELVLWSTAEFNFVRLGDAVTTGSSMMPNKKNPDGAELLRGKAGRVFGDLIGLLTTLKGLPLAYNKDLQEDKRALFDAFDTIILGLDMALEMVRQATFNLTRMRAACSGWVNATDLCEALVRAGEPLRVAHHQTGRLVALAVERGVELEELPMDDVLAHAPRATHAMLADLALDPIIGSKDVVGGTAPARVRDEAARLRAWCGQ